MNSKGAMRWLMPILGGWLLLVPALAAQQGGETGESEVRLEIGAWETSVDDSPDVVAEYEPVGGGAEARLEAALEQGWGNLLLLFERRDGDDSAGSLEFDIERAIRSHTTWLSLIHRLGHEPLDPFTTATNHGRVVWHSDLDPTDEYQITYSELEHRTEIQPRESSFFTLGLGFRRQDRRGLIQSTTVSHCDACHVVSQSRPLDERTEEASLDGLFTFAKGQLELAFTHRELSEGVRNITLLFDDALQPELRVPVFDNRLQWDSAGGPQPVHQKPDITKDVGKLDFTYSNWGGLVVNVTGVTSTTENTTTGFAADYHGVLVNLARNLDRWKLRWRSQLYTLDNDDVFVDTIERVGIAGPQAGRTLREIYGFDPDFLRRSSLDRDVSRSRFDATFQLGGQRGKVKLLWDWQQVDREHFAVTDGGETDTTENILGVSWWTRPAEGLRIRAAVRHGEVDNPFGNPNGGFSINTGPAVPSPFAPQADQYYEFQDARIGDLFASPESWDELRAGLTRVRGETSFSASYRFWDGENTSGDLADWSRTHQSLTASVWQAPGASFTWHIAATWHETELELPASIPLFDG